MDGVVFHFQDVAVRDEIVRITGTIDSARSREKEQLQRIFYGDDTVWIAGKEAQKPFRNKLIYDMLFEGEDLVFSESMMIEEFDVTRPLVEYYSGGKIESVCYHENCFLVRVSMPFKTERGILHAVQRLSRKRGGSPMKYFSYHERLGRNFTFSYSDPSCSHLSCACSLNVCGKNVITSAVNLTSYKRDKTVQIVDLIDQVNALFDMVDGRPRCWSGAGNEPIVSLNISSGMSYSDAEVEEFLRQCYAGGVIKN